jgi:hypothetical protein
LIGGFGVDSTAGVYGHDQRAVVPRQEAHEIGGGEDGMANGLCLAVEAADGANGAGVGVHSPAG